MPERIEPSQQFERLARMLADNASTIRIHVGDMVQPGDRVLLLLYPKWYQPFDKLGKPYGSERLVVPQIAVNTQTTDVHVVYAYDSMPYGRETFDLVVADEDFSEAVLSEGNNEYGFAEFFNLVARVLKPGGKAYFYPIRDHNRHKMYIGLEAMKLGNTDTDYFWGVNKALDELVVIGNKVPGPLYRGRACKPVPKLVYATDEELAQYPLETPGLFSVMEVRDKPDLTPLFKTQRWRYVNGLPYQLAPGHLLRRGDDVLYLNSLDIFQPITPGVIINAYIEVCRYLELFPSITYLMTTTWLDRLVKGLGFREAEMSIPRSEAEAFINHIQNLQLRQLFTQPDMSGMAQITERALKKFKIGNFKNWLCPAREFRWLS